MHSYSGNRIIVTINPMASLATTVLTGSAKVGDRVFIGIYLNCPAEVAVGVDVLLDVSKELSVQSIIPMKLLGGDTFDRSQGNHVVSSELTPVAGANFSGGGLLAVLDCVAAAKGTATITFAFTPGATTDCNVASPAGKDLLTSVANRSMLIS